MFGGPWDSTLIMMGVPSLKMGVPSFYIILEFWKLVHPSVKGFEQALAGKHQVIFVSQTLYRLNQIDRNFCPLFRAGFEMIQT